jgi:hypothetical protein
MLSLGISSKKAPILADNGLPLQRNNLETESRRGREAALSSLSHRKDTTEFRGFIRLDTATKLRERWPSFYHDHNVIRPVGREKQHHLHHPSLKYGRRAAFRCSLIARRSLCKYCRLGAER